MNGFLVSAAHKSSGKTTISIGLCAALRARGLSIQPFKKGPDYIDPMWLTRASGNPCYNLDFHVMEPESLHSFYNIKSAVAEISVVEGNKGLYDGLDLDGSNSNAALARLLGLPVILVLDARGMTRGIAPLILGYQQFDPNIRIGGVVLNLLGGSRHESKLRAVIEHYTDVPVIGAVHRSSHLAIDERHLGLIPSNEHDSADQHTARLGKVIADSVDLELLLKLTEISRPSPASFTSTDRYKDANLRIAIAQDEAFGFYYSDDLEALEREGATLVPFSPINDESLPENIDGIIVGGGFPETHAPELAENRAMRESIKAAIENGLPAYAECGGLMYLSKTLQWNDRIYDMANVIPGDILMHKRPQGRGYVCFSITDTHPWNSEDLPSVSDLSAHEFHYSSIENLPADAKFAYRINRGHGINGSEDGLVMYNMLACYTHLRNSARFCWTTGFLNFVRRCQCTNTGNC